jgi:SLOG cluster2
LTEENEINIAGIDTQLESIIDQQPARPADSSTAPFVGISISLSHNLEKLGFTHLHLEDVLTETARYLLVNNYNLVYGGDLRSSGFTNQLADIIRLYTPWIAEKQNSVHNYLAWPIHINVTNQTEAALLAMGVTLKKCKAPTGVDEKNYIPPDTIDNRIIWASALLGMRHEIVAATQARIIIGGQVANFMGRIPGVLEEAWLTLKQGKAIYLCGAMGGVAQSIINAIYTGKDSYLNNDFQFHNNGYKEFYEAWNTKFPAYSINYESIIDDFHQTGVSGLSEINGLSVEQNMRLFSTPHPQEMISLILRGLKEKKK